jgi:hypothetical protein
LRPPSFVTHEPSLHTAGATQALPHLPQLLSSVFVSAQPDGQQVSPTVQAGPVPQNVTGVQELDTQLWPRGQTVPQWPQLLESFVVLVQPSAQHWSGDVHAGPVPHPMGMTHELPAQVSSGGHGLPQPPQLLGSVAVSVQPEGQHDCDPVHAGPPLQAVVDWHIPPTHLSPEGHGCPQPPQFFGSVMVFEQPEAQQTSLPVHAGSPLQFVALEHSLSMHDWPIGQTWPQLPQLSGSVDVSAHPILQHSCPGGHAGPSLHSTGVWQEPPSQVAPAAQALPQDPQFLGSLFVSAHPLVQHCSSGLHAGPPLQLVGTWHALDTHASPGEHALPQLPQSSGFVFSSTHSPAQHDRPSVHALPPPHTGTHSWS